MIRYLRLFSFFFFFTIRFCSCIDIRDTEPDPTDDDDNPVEQIMAMLEDIIDVVVPRLPSNANKSVS